MNHEFEDDLNDDLRSNYAYAIAKVVGVMDMDRQI